MKVSIPTPQIGHFTEADYQHIYEPAEDSFILLDALEEDADDIRLIQPSLCVEIGVRYSNSFSVKHLRVDDRYESFLYPLTLAYLTTDINPHACHATLRTARANNATVDPVRGDLLSSLLPRVAGEVDVLIFNPPYVPTDEEECVIQLVLLIRRLQTQTQQGIGGAWAGGALGMTVTNRLLEILPSHLSPRGRFYLVAIEQNRPTEIIAQCSPSLAGRIVLRRRAGREHLSVICFVQQEI